MRSFSRNADRSSHSEPEYVSIGVTVELSEYVSDVIAVSKPEYVAIVESKCITFQCGELISFRIAEHLAVFKPEYVSISLAVIETDDWTFEGPDVSANCVADSQREVQCCGTQRKL